MASLAGDLIDNSTAPTCVVSFSCVCCPSAVLRNWCLVGMLGHVGHFLFQNLFVQCGFSVGRFVGVANSCIYLSGFGYFVS